MQKLKCSDCYGLYGYLNLNFMATKGRKKGIKNGEGQPNNKGCHFCEGTGLHYGDECKACDGTGEEIVRKQMQKVYNSKNKLPLNYNLRPCETES
jgi:hypothetical protein